MSDEIAGLGLQASVRPATTSFTEEQLVADQLALADVLPDGTRYATGIDIRAGEVQA
jgi:hypothetical protein